MKSKEQIFEHLKRVLVDLFEIDPQKITLDAHLYDELGIDSIDTIDLALELKQITGKRIQPEQFRHVRTVGDAVDAVYELLGGAKTGA